MTDLEFFSSNPNIAHRLRDAFDGEAPEGCLIAVRITECEILKRIAPPESEVTSNERMARYAFEDGTELLGGFSNEFSG